MTSFPTNSYYSFHRIGIKVGGQLDHEVIQRMLFRGYSTPNFNRDIALFNEFPDIFWFPDNSSYSFL